MGYDHSTLSDVAAERFALPSPMATVAAHRPSELLRVSS